jgi:hypothetical protein
LSSKVGFLVGIGNHADPLDGILTEDFQFLFTESGISYFKNADVRQLDNEIGDIEVVRNASLEFNPKLARSSHVRCFDTGRLFGEKKQTLSLS